jgi:flagellar biosynthesis/type III secretory pathway M-ring protein FliF/YscJ
MVDVLAPLAIFVLLLVIVYVVTGPLRRGAMSAAEAREQSDRQNLEAARDAKYREIRDAELDHETGKMSQEDWRALDRELRAEAVVILQRLDDLDGR